MNGSQHISRHTDQNCIYNPLNDSNRLDKLNLQNDSGMYST